MSKIFKYKLKKEFLTEQTLPRSFGLCKDSILKCGLQHGEIVVWAISKDYGFKSTFMLVPTGQAFEEQHYQYVDTIVDGNLVYHAFVRN